MPLVLEVQHVPVLYLLIRFLNDLQFRYSFRARFAECHFRIKAPILKLNSFRFIGE